MFTVLAMSTASVAACLVTVQRVVGWKAILKHSTLIDVTFTLVLGWFLAGTLTGALVAILGGLFMALTLSMLKKAVSLGESVATAAARHPDIPAGADPADYNAQGVWWPDAILAQDYDVTA